MLDDVDITGILVLIYLAVIFMGITGIWFFLKKKMILGVIFWASTTANFFCYLYFMGNYRLYPKIFYPVINKYWPWINLVLFILLIVNFIKNKYAKKEKVN